MEEHEIVNNLKEVVDFANTSLVNKAVKLKAEYGKPVVDSITEIYRNNCSYIGFTL